MAGELPLADAAANTPRTIATCAPMTEPAPAAKKVFTEEILLGK
jgi:hypothetical protein